MRKIKFVSGLLAVIFCAVYTSSCKSIESRTAIPDTDTTTVTTTAISTIANGDFGGIVYSAAPVTADTAAPIPGMDFVHTTTADEPADSSDGDDTTADTAETVSDVEAPAAETTSATTRRVTTAPPPRETSPDMVVRDTGTTAAATTETATSAVTAAETTTTTAETTAATTAKTAAQTLAAPDTSGYTGGSYTKNSYKALNYAYVKAVWISYIELTTLFGKSESDFAAAFGVMLDNCQSLGLNTVFVHARAFGDAYYFSDLYPFTKQLSGNLGVRTSFDPMKIMISEAHKRKISFHAWINPLRLCYSADMPLISENYPVGKWYNGAENGTYIVNVNGTWFLNPAYEEVRKLIGDGVRELVSGYDVDGIHIDDYFYPTTDTYFDSAAYSVSGYNGLDSFRVAMCSEMVREIYNAAHECGSVIFGAAPQGNNYNNLYALYADTKAWCKGGYIDYFAPQIYYGFENGGVPFAGNVDEWRSIVSGTKTRLITGLSVYKAGNEDKWAGTGKYEWMNTDTMLKRQKEYADEAGCNGIALYSYNYIFSPSYNTAAMKAEIDNLRPLLTD